jgi:hypothetical protein
MTTDVLILNPDEHGIMREPANIKS